jgi:putative transcriptional regulator
LISGELNKTVRRLAILLALGLAPLQPAHSQEGDAGGALTLVASPWLVDPNYRAAVLLAVQVEDNRHVGVIINRPTGRSLASLFPGHAPSRLVRDPVYFGGPMLRQAIFALVRTDHAPGAGSIRMMRELFLASQAAVVDRIIEQTPNDARYYIGYVAWRPGELRREVDRGMWFVLDPDPDLVFRKDPKGLWEELLKRARAVTAQRASQRRAAVALASFNRRPRARLPVPGDSPG